MTRRGDAHLDERWVEALRRAGPEGRADDATWGEVVARAGTGPGGGEPHRAPARLVAATAVAAMVVIAALVWWGREDDGDRVRAQQPPTAAGPEIPKVTGVTGRWEQLPSAPLSPRARTVRVWTGDELLVVGGDTFACPANANCVAPDDPPLADGAALDPATGRWRAIAAAPLPFAAASTAVVAGNVYFLFGERARGETFLRYSLRADSWTELSPPGGTGWYQLVAAGDTVLAVSGSDEGGPRPDLAFDAEEGVWRELPDDPLPRTYGRSAVWSAPYLYTFAKELVPDPGADGPSLVLAARLDLGTGEWERLPDSEIIGYGPWLAVGDLLVSPGLGGADGGEVGNWGRRYPDGGIFDAAALEWRSLPVAPEGAAQSAGAFGDGGAWYGSTGGLVLDVERGVWVDMPRLPDDGDGDVREVAAASTAAVVVGGVRWLSDAEETAPLSTQAELLSDTWIWRPR